MLFFVCFGVFWRGFLLLFCLFFDAELGVSHSLLVAKTYSKTSHGPPVQNTHAMGIKASHNNFAAGNLLLPALSAVLFSWVLERGLTLKCSISSGEMCGKINLIVGYADTPQVIYINLILLNS